MSTSSQDLKDVKYVKLDHIELAELRLLEAYNEKYKFDVAWDNPLVDSETGKINIDALKNTQTDRIHVLQLLQFPATLFWSWSIGYQIEQLVGPHPGNDEPASVINEVVRIADSSQKTEQYCWSLNSGLLLQGGVSKLVSD